MVDAKLSIFKGPFSLPASKVAVQVLLNAENFDIQQAGLFVGCHQMTQCCTSPAACVSQVCSLGPRNEVGTVPPCPVLQLCTALQLV